MEQTTDIKKLQEQIDALKSRIDEIEETHKDQMALVVFSGDLDKILAAMIIAVGATAMDTEVKIFFTFWATAALRDKYKKGKGKDTMSKMFGAMLPKGQDELKLSKMNMGGLGTSMIKKIMKKQNVNSLADLFKLAGELGVEINICEMSMDLMGFKKEEMIDYPKLSYAGVATFLADANESRIQLFI